MFNLFRNLVRRLLGLHRHVDETSRLDRSNNEVSSTMRFKETANISAEQLIFDRRVEPVDLAQCKVSWALGDWNALLAIDNEACKQHSNREEIALYLAASRLQQDRGKDEARQLVKQAIIWGATRDQINRILISGVHNSLCRAAEIAKLPQRAISHFQSAVNIVSPVSNVGVLLNSRRTDALLKSMSTVCADLEHKNLSKIKQNCAHEFRLPFSSADYWEERYREGRTSGSGSYGRLAQFKADTINEFVKSKNIKQAIEFGCGDGNQLSMFHIPSYIGVDVSQDIVAKCRARFADDPNKFFLTTTEFAQKSYTAEITLSLDVIFHLVEDEIFKDYIKILLNASEKYCIIYSCNEDVSESDSIHVKRRKFTAWIEANHPEWKLLQVIYNKYPHDGTLNPQDSSFSDFYFYQKLSTI